MGNKYYIRAANDERMVRDLLESEGNLAYRVAGSHSEADVVLNPKRRIQLKACKEKDFNKYLKEKVEGVELWLHITDKQVWVIID